MNTKIPYGTYNFYQHTHTKKKKKKKKQKPAIIKSKASHEQVSVEMFKMNNFVHFAKNVNRKLQGVPQSQTAAYPRHQEEETMTKTNTYKTNKQMHKKHTDQLLFPKEVITMLQRMKKYEDKKHGKTLKHEAPVV